MPWLASAPQAFFAPSISLAALFNGFPPTAVFTLLNMFLALCICFLLVGYRTRYVSVGVTVLLIMINSWGYALGKINHDILLVLTPMVLSPSGWGEALSLDALRIEAKGDSLPRGNWCVALLAFLIGICMLSSGWDKASNGWLDPTIHSTYGHMITNMVVTGRQPWLADMAIRWMPMWMWELGDWFAVVLEIGFLPAVFSRRVFFPVLVLACVFHFAIWALYDIPFGANIMCYAAFLSYSSVALCIGRRKIIRGMNRFQQYGALIVLLIVAAILAALALALNTPLDELMGIPVYPAVVVLGFGTACVFVAFTVLRAIRRGRESVNSEVLGSRSPGSVQE